MVTLNKALSTGERTILLPKDPMKMNISHAQQDTSKSTNEVKYKYGQCENFYGIMNLSNFYGITDIIYGMARNRKCVL